MMVEEPTAELEKGAVRKVSCGEFQGEIWSVAE